MGECIGFLYRCPSGTPNRWNLPSFSLEKSVNDHACNSWTCRFLSRADHYKFKHLYIKYADFVRGRPMLWIKLACVFSKQRQLVLKYKPRLKADGLYHIVLIQNRAVEKKAGGILYWHS